MKKYVTYGFGDTFIPEKLVTDLKESIGKPMSAWWGSPVDSEYGWIDWCNQEEFIPKGASFDKYFTDNNKIIWTLDESAKILEVNEVADLEDYFELGYIEDKSDEPEYKDYHWNFYKVLEAGYSAIELTDGGIGHYFHNRIELMMNSWDCESIVVLDPSKIIQVKE